MDSGSGSDHSPAVTVAKKRSPCPDPPKRPIEVKTNRFPLALMAGLTGLPPAEAPR